jgi:oligosaccharide reducing-end xylanase
MKMKMYLIAVFAFWIPIAGARADGREGDVNDHRGKMTPREKGSRETGDYRNVFLEAGYGREEIDAKLAKAYRDVF